MNTPPVFLPDVPRFIGCGGSVLDLGGAMSILGTRVVRTEDPRLLTTGATYLEDLRLPELRGAAYATFVRSPMAHARITGIDVSAALEEPGVVAVLTAHDFDDVPDRPATASEEPLLAGD